MADVLQNDVIFVVRVLPELMLMSRFKIVGKFVVVFLILTAVLCGYILFTTLEKDFWKNYSLLVCGSTMGFSYYCVVILKKAEYLKLRNEVFSKFWSLHTMGEKTYQQITASAKNAKIFVIITIISSFATSTAGLPWYGNEYDIMLPVRAFTDYLGKWANPILVVFYLSVYHVVFTMISTAFILIHFCLHLRFQYCLLNKKLQQLRIHPVDDDNYHSYVRQELVLSIKYHEVLLWVGGKFNKLIYYPIFMITTSSIFFSVSLIFYLKDFDNSFIRGTTLGLTGLLVTAGFCVTGQLLQDESERLFYSALLLPWRFWNITNQKILLILLTKTKNPVILSSSGIVIVNHTLFLSLYRKVTSVLSFFMNV